MNSHEFRINGILKTQNWCSLSILGYLLPYLNSDSMNQRPNVLKSVTFEKVKQRYESEMCKRGEEIGYQSKKSLEH